MRLISVGRPVPTLYMPVAELVSALPDTLGLFNPFTGAKALPVDGPANDRGEIGYQRLTPEIYKVTGFGHDGLLVTVTNRSQT